MEPRVSFTVFGEKSGAAKSHQASSNSPTVAVVRTVTPRSASVIIAASAVCTSLAATHRPRGVPLLASERIAAEVHPQLPRRPSLPHETRHLILLGREWQRVQRIRRATQEGGSDLVFRWQPVRDSNPCRHLARANRVVRPVLSDAVVFGLSRGDGSARDVPCRPTLNGIAA